MPKGRPWHDDELVTMITRVHREWLSDAHAQRGRVPFSVGYCVREGGMGSTMYVLRGTRDRFARVLATCAERVRRDWQEPPNWTVVRVEAELQRYFVAWQSDQEDGQPAGKPWYRGYIRRHGGKHFARTVDQPPLDFEFHLRRLGGPILDLWEKRWNRWEPENARERLRTALRQWEQDARHGRLAGKPFGFEYLLRHSKNRVLDAITKHYRGGINAFVRTVPEAANVWRFRPRRTPAGVRDEIAALYREWLRDTDAKAVRFPFGPSYFAVWGKERLYLYVLRRGIGAILRGSGMAAVRKVFGRPIELMNTRECIARRNAYIAARGCCRESRRTRMVHHGETQRMDG